MIDVSLLPNALAFCEEHKSKYSGCIHYKNERELTRDVIPLVENVLYGICLVSTLSKEKAEKGLSFLERVFHFCTDNGFGSYLHDFPHVYNDRANVDICLALSFFLKNYGRVIPSSSRNKIEAIREKLVVILQKRPLNDLDKYVFDTACFKEQRAEIEATSLPEYERIILCKLLMGEEVTLSWHRPLNAYTGPLVETYYKGHYPTDSLISGLVTGKGTHQSALYAALLPKKGVSDLIKYEPYEREDLVINHRNDLLSIHFGEHSLVAKGDFDLKVTDDHIDIFLDEFEEMEFYFTDYKESSILVEGERATAFYPNNEISLFAGDKVIIMKFRSNINFMGHIMKGNRDNQILDCDKNFSLFEHRILLRKVL